MIVQRLKMRRCWNRSKVQRVLLKYENSRVSFYLVFYDDTVSFIGCVYDTSSGWCFYASSYCRVFGFDCVSFAIIQWLIAYVAYRLTRSFYWFWSVIAYHKSNQKRTNFWVGKLHSIVPVECRVWETIRLGANVNKNLYQVLSALDGGFYLCW